MGNAGGRTCSVVVTTLCSSTAGSRSTPAIRALARLVGGVLSANLIRKTRMYANNACRNGTAEPTPFLFGIFLLLPFDLGDTQQCDCGRLHLSRPLRLHPRDDDAPTHAKEKKPRRVAAWRLFRRPLVVRSVRCFPSSPERGTLFKVCFALSKVPF